MSASKIHVVYQQVSYTSSAGKMHVFCLLISFVRCRFSVYTNKSAGNIVLKIILHDNNIFIKQINIKTAKISQWYKFISARDLYIMVA